MKMLLASEIRKIAIIVLAVRLLFKISSSNFIFVDAAMTMAQMEKTMETMRTVCSSKHKVSDELIDGLKKGQFIETNNDLKCYTLCVAQMTGTLTKKNELSHQKIVSQIEKLMPDEMKENAMATWMACKDVQTNYKEPCDRLFFSTKCMYDFNPQKFIFP